MACCQLTKYNIIGLVCINNINSREYYGTYVL